MSYRDNLKLWNVPRTREFFIQLMMARHYIWTSAYLLDPAKRAIGDKKELTALKSLMACWVSEHCVLCLYVCVCVFYICMCVYVFVRVYVYVCCMRMRPCVCMRLFVWVCVYASVCVCARMYVCVCVCISLYMCVLSANAYTGIERRIAFVKGSGYWALIEPPLLKSRWFIFHQLHKSRFLSHAPP